MSSGARFPYVDPRGSAARREEAVQRAAPPRVLVVDDDRVVLKGVGAFLTMAGYEVHCAGALEQARLLLSHIPFSVLVTDLHLRGGLSSEGLELCRQVRADHPGTRLVLLTGAAAADVEPQASSLRLDAILYKPCPMSCLAGVLGGLFWGGSAEDIDSEKQETAPLG